MHTCMEEWAFSQIAIPAEFEWFFWFWKLVVGTIIASPTRIHIYLAYLDLPDLVCKIGTEIHPKKTY